MRRTVQSGLNRPIVDRCIVVVSEYRKCGIAVMLITIPDETHRLIKTDWFKLFGNSCACLYITIHQVFVVYRCR